MFVSDVSDHFNSVGKVEPYFLSAGNEVTIVEEVQVQLMPQQFQIGCLLSFCIVIGNYIIVDIFPENVMFLAS